MAVSRREQQLGTRCLWLDKMTESFASPVVALGFFDGVHIGHRAILDIVQEEARRLAGTSIALTFDRHPSEIAKPGHAPKLLTTLDERVRLLAEAGMDVVVTANFSAEFAAFPPEKFVGEVLVEKLKVKGVVAGYDYRFGYRGEGNMELMRRLAEKYGFSVTTVGPIEVDGQVVSSTLIRKFLAAGEVEKAARLLTQNYQITGTVIDGEKRARRLGFPTANLRVSPEKMLPADGVYAVRVYRDRGSVAACGTTSQVGVLSISDKPTFGGKMRAVEVHVLDTADDFYGQELRVEFVTRLRPIFQFNTAAELAQQVRDDIKRTRQIFSLI